MKSKYQIIRDRTPTKYQNCVVGACPRIYEVARDCTMVGCPSIYEDKKGKSYLIIGKSLGKKEAKKFGLESKIGSGEALIQVPKELVDRGLHK